MFTADSRMQSAAPFAARLGVARGDAGTPGRAERKSVPRCRRRSRSATRGVTKTKAFFLSAALTLRASLRQRGIHFSIFLPRLPQLRQPPTSWLPKLLHPGLPYVVPTALSFVASGVGLAVGVADSHRRPVASSRILAVAVAGSWKLAAQQLRGLAACSQLNADSPPLLLPLFWLRADSW